MHDKIKMIATRYQGAKDQIKTEEAAKNALIMPFLAALGYDIFNPMEVVPEFGAGIGAKKADKIDYAIKHGDSISILVECKHFGIPLSHNCISQLFHYFTACDAHLAILTNGVEYQFFADVDHANKMDRIPFFVFNILNFDEVQLSELKKFSKDEFNEDAILAKAKDMKDQAAVKAKLEDYLINPSDPFVKCILADLGYSGTKTQQIVNNYSGVVTAAFAEIIKDKVTARLKKALNQNQEGLENMGLDADINSTDESVPVDEDDGIVTTVEEIEAYAIIKAIAGHIIPVGRVFMRDAKSYCAILLDNKNYKPIARLYFNNLNNKRLNLFAGPDDKKGQMFPIIGLDEIFNYADKVKNLILTYDAQPPSRKARDDVARMVVGGVPELTAADTASTRDALIDKSES